MQVKFELEKETKGTFRFKETGEKEDYKIGTLYVKKTAFQGTAPDKLTVTLGWGKVGKKKGKK